MKPEIQEAIDAFTELQSELEEFGAADTEPETMFHEIIRLAVAGESFPDGLDAERWDLDSESEPEEAARSLTEAAQTVYDVIRTDADADDFDALKAYAWRTSF